MQTVGGSEWLNELCVHVAALTGWLSATIVHEVAVSASGRAVHVGVTAVEQCIFSIFSLIAAQH